jgi:hypothetical protein
MFKTKEAKMPGGDRTGPGGQGAMTGRGLGFCSGDNPNMYGRGLGRGLGRGIGFGARMGLGRGIGFGARMGLGRGIRFGAGMGLGSRRGFGRY